MVPISKWSQQNNFEMLFMLSQFCIGIIVPCRLMSGGHILFGSWPVNSGSNAVNLNSV
jgi:hypothetical protein